nr:heavy metal translocating P-type ATPase [Spirochaetales bacterium]
TCASCVSSVEKALKKVKGVQDASVNLVSETAYVLYSSNQVNREALYSAVDAVGYHAVGEAEQETKSGVKTSEIDKDEKKVQKAKRLMWSAWAATIPIILWMIPEMVFGYMFLGPLGLNLGMLLLAGFVLFIPGRETLKSGFKSGIHFSPNMDALITIGTLASFTTGFVSLLQVLGIGPAFSSFAGVSGMIMAFHLTGRYIETKAKGRASQAIKKLLTLEAKEANVERDGKEVKVPMASLLKGDIMVIRPGDKIPTDGEVVKGESSVDESLATGESMPVSKKTGDSVIGATINKNGLLKIKATKIGKETFLSQVIKMVEEAQGTKIPIQAFADKVTGIFVPIVILIALVTLLSWLTFPDFFSGIIAWAAMYIPWVEPGMGVVAQALFATVAVLVIACPCALGLATPTALMVGSGKGAENGVLIRKGAAIQTIKDVTKIIFDKTGTITEGKPGVTDILPAEGIDRDRLIRLAGAVERSSEHPLGAAIAVFAEEHYSDTLLEAEEFQAITGRGVKALVDGYEILVGTAKLMEESGISLSKEDQKKKADLEDQAKTAMYVAVNGRIAGIIAVADREKPDSRLAVTQLRKLGLQPVMNTGDNERTALAIAKKVGIDEVIANVMPDEKAKEVRRLQSEGNIVAMVGDGINDAPALTQADVGIAIGTGTDVAIEAGDIVLVQGELSAVVKAVKLSKATFRKIRQNLFWAFFYNVVMIPLAFIGIMHPVLAEIAMAASSINVVLNSRRLQNADLKPDYEIK